MGNYTLSSLPNFLNLVFNLSVDLVSGSIDLYDKDTNLLIHSFTQGELSKDDETIVQAFNLDNYITQNGNYYFNVPQGLVIGTNVGVDNTSVLDNETWSFKVGNADFNSSDFNNNDFFT